ncbi:MAG: hypothetical protein EXS08_10405 [Planctomycetes bacterium]|nr:hypothetical protein [Planctomycetota bacterium]
MPRLPGILLGVLFIAALIAHTAWMGPSVWMAFPGLGSRFVDTLVALAGALLFGRVLLAYLPPGDVGAHAARALPATLATSFAVGLPIFARLQGGELVGGSALLAVALVLRLLTLPGAMVPRHGVPSEPWGHLDALLAVAGVAWCGCLTLSADGDHGLLWFALFLLQFNALGGARRARLGRYLLLGLGAFAPLLAVDAAYPTALALGLGASALIPWLRRHDRRAGALAALGFGALFLNGADPLALAGVLLFVLASHRRQRLFALAWATGASLSALALVFLTGGAVLDGRGRGLDLVQLRERALDLSSYGLGWPSVALALGLGALAFPWRARAWASGEIESPRREALALVVLLVLVCAALALPASPWSEEEALVIAFPLCALLAGLLLIPPERVRA